VKAHQHYRSGWVVLALVAVVAAAAWLRFHDLARESLWYDEGVSCQMAGLPWAEVVRLTAQDVHPPLYYFLLKAWAWAFGDSVLALRSLSALCGVATVVAVFFFTRSLGAAPPAGQAGDEAPRRAGGSGPALLAAALTALSLFQIAHGREMRMYPLGALLAVLSSWALCAALFRPARTLAPWVAYAGLAAALAYTHNYGLFTVAAQALFAGGYLLWGRVGEEAQARRRADLWRATLAFLVVGLAYLPWLSVALGQNGRVVAAFWIPPLTLNSAAAAVENFFTGTREFRADPSAGLAAPLVVAALVVTLLLRKDRAAACLVLLGVVPLALGLAVSLVQGRNILMGRYLCFSGPFLLMGMALVVSGVPGPALRVTVACLLVAGFAAQLWVYWQDGYRTYNPGLQDVARVIRENYQEGDVVVTRKETDFYAMNYYLRPRATAFLWLPSGIPPGSSQLRTFLRDDDLLLRDRPLPSSHARIWLLKVREEGLPGPGDVTYRLVGCWQFREAVPYRGFVIDLELHEREDHPPGNNVTGTTAVAPVASAAREGDVP
jgi:mannosyltransferase